MPPARRRKPRLDQGLIMEPRRSNRRARKQPGRPRRAQTRGPVHVQELVRELLNIDGRSRAIRRRNFWPRRAVETLAHRRGPSYDNSEPAESTDTLEESESVAPSTIEDSTEMIETANSSVVTSSRSSTVSDDLSSKRIGRPRSTYNDYLERRSLVQLINNCLMAGLEEGKRQAEKYLRRALSFGLKAGYLIPADPRGKVIRLLPDLARTARKVPAKPRKQTRNVKSGPALGIWDHIGHRRADSARSRRTRPRDDSIGEKIPTKRKKKLSKRGNSAGRETNISKTRPGKKIVDGPGRGRDSQKGLQIKRKAKENTGKKATRSGNKYGSKRRTRSSVVGKNKTDNCTDTRLDHGDGDRDNVGSGGNETNQRIQPELGKSGPNLEECRPGQEDEVEEALAPGASYENDGNERIRIST